MQCPTCGLGQFLPDCKGDQMGHCTDCPANIFFSSGATVCVNCPNNSISSRGSTIDGCPCKPGYTLAVEHAKHVRWGLTKNLLASIPARCAREMPQQLQASIYRADCMCDKGLTGPDGGMYCSACEAGEFKDSIGSAVYRVPNGQIFKL